MVAESKYSALDLFVENESFAEKTRSGDTSKRNLQGFYFLGSVIQ